MKRKNAVVSLLIAFAMLFTVFAFNVPEAEAAVDKNTYWIKVNTQCNVVTVYKKSGSEYKPIRAMVCSCGKKGSPPLLRAHTGWELRSAGATLLVMYGEDTAWS